MRDLTIALRTLLKAPAFAIVSILSLALATGANSAIFSLIDAVLLRPLPGIRQTQRLAAIYTSNTREASPLAAVSWPDYLYYRQHNHVFSGMLAYTRLTFLVSGGDLPENVPGELASDNYFDLLGAAPQLGRVFIAGERGDVVVLSDRYWRDRFHADPAVVGKTMTIGNHSFEVIGVTAATFHGVLLDWGDRPQLWIPIEAYRDASSVFAGFDMARTWQIGIVMVNARLKDGVGLPQAAAEMEVLRKNIDSGDPARAAQREREGWGISILPLARFYPAYRARIVSILTVLLAVVLGVLLVACTNIAALMLIRADQRRKETAVRLAVGAGAADLARLLLSESLWIGAAGCAAGLLVASAGIRALLSFPRLSVISLSSLDLAVDWRVCAFAASVTGISAVFFGLAPLRQSMKSDLIAGLKSRSSDRGTSRRGLLQMIQIGVTLVLLAGASLFLRTFRNAAAADPFLHSGNLMLANVETNEVSGAGAFFDQLLDQTRALPGVQSAGAVWVLPLSGMRTNRETATLLGAGGGPLPTHPQTNIVSTGYFQTIGSPIVSGRDFRSSDHEGTAIVNQEMAKTFWHSDPVGLQIVRRNKTLTIVGVVSDSSRRGYRDPVGPCLYLPVTQENQREMSLVVRTTGAPFAMLPAIRSTAGSLSKNAVIDHVRTLAMYENEVLAQEKIAAWCLGLLALLALILSMVGLYGAMAWSTSRRQAEIGVRMALGATRAHVMRMILGGAVRIAAGGILTGAIASMALMRYAKSMLYGVTGADPFTWAIVAALLSIAVLAATMIPALRAANIDPASALRSD
jgi:predicted permease